MRNQAVSKILTAVAILALGFIGQACDDGELNLGSGVSPSITPYVAITAEPMSVDKGGSTTLTWTVANADTVSIASAGGGEFTFSTEDIDMAGETEGSLVVDGITATTTFVITAKSMVATPNIVEPSLDPYIPVSVGLNVHKSGQITIPEEEPQLSMSPVEVTDSVTVTVTDSGPLSASLTATPDGISEGQKSCLCWEVSSAATSFAITSTTGETITATDECNFDNSVDVTESNETGTFQYTPFLLQMSQPFMTLAKSMGIGEAKAETTGLPNSGCATVSPPAPGAVYTVTANDAAGNQATDSATLKVDVSNFDPNGSYINAEGQHPKYQPDSFDNLIAVNFGILPAHLAVSVEADKTSAQCGQDGSASLPSGDVLSGGTGSSMCKLEEDTTFTLYAHINGQKRFVDMVMVLGAAGAGRVKITAQPWAFEGEEVNIKVQAKTAADAQLINKIRIIGQNVVERTAISTTPIAETVVVPSSGVRIEVYSSSDETPQSFQAVQALPLMPIGVLGSPITSVKFDPNDINRSYYGTLTNVAAQGVPFVQSTINMYRNDNLTQEPNINGEIGIPYGELLALFNEDYTDIFLAGNDQFVQDFRDYATNAITVEKGNQSNLFVGIYGGIVMSHDAGATWELLWSPLLVGAYSASDQGTHESCAGEIARGTDAEHKGDLISMVGVCDIVLDGASVIAATDNGMLVIKDIATVQSDPFNESNIVYVTMDHGETAQVLDRHVINDLEEVEINGVKKIFAAVADGNRAAAMGDVSGVYVSTESSEAALGTAWTSFGLEDQDVYAVKVDMNDGDAVKLYAATANGIFVSDVDQASWTQVYSDDVPFSLADDPYTTGVIIAGLGQGAMITRDGGQNWGALLAGGMTTAGKVMDIDLVAKPDSATGMINYRAAFGSTGGFLAGKVLAPATDTEITIETPDDDDNTPPEDDTTDDTIVTEVQYHLAPAQAYYTINQDD